jgi:hypothetical protein
VSSNVISSTKNESYKHIIATISTKARNGAEEATKELKKSEAMMHKLKRS